MSEHADIDPEGDSASELIRKKTQSALDLIAARLPKGMTCSAEIDPAVPEMVLVFTGINPLAGEAARVKVAFKTPSMEIGKIYSGTPINDILNKREPQKIVAMHKIGGIVMNAFLEKGLIEKPMPVNPEGVLYQMQKSEALAIISRFGGTIDTIKDNLPANITLREIGANVKTNSLALIFSHPRLGTLGKVIIEPAADDASAEIEKPLFNDDYGEEVLFKDEDDEEDTLPQKKKGCFKILNFYFNRDDGHVKERQVLMNELGDIVIEAFGAASNPKRRLFRGEKPETPPPVSLREKNEGRKEIAGAGSAGPDGMPQLPRYEIPPDMRKKLTDAIATRAFIPGKRIEMAIPKDNKIRTSVDVTAFCLTWHFVNEKRGVLGRINVVYSNPELNPVGLYCGINNFKDEYSKERETMMLEFYEIAKKVIEQ